jgi:hypothetical protein
MAAIAGVVEARRGRTGRRAGACAATRVAARSHRGANFRARPPPVIRSAQFVRELFVVSLLLQTDDDDAM